jgi:hypothetical protein
MSRSGKFFDLMANGFAHLSEHVVLAQRHFGAESHFFEELSMLVNRGNAKIGPAEVYTNGKIRHKN